MRGFMTQDLFQTIKSRISGPYCERLWTDEEWDKHHAEKKNGITWLPKGMTVAMRDKGGK